MESKTIRFVRRGELVSLGNVPPERTLLEVLREDLACTGTKEGCGEGDCGACTVVVAEPHAGGLQYRAINSCIRLAHSIDGMALWTVEDLAGADGGLHPAQEALVQAHGSQCGFCTPGFVMSLFGMYQNHVCRGGTITRELAQEELSGNLCRCTGYRPILDAAQQMAQLPAAKVDESSVLALLQELRSERVEAGGNYLAPTALGELLALRARHPDAQLVAGCTDVGLWVTKMHRQFAQVLDVTRVEELRRVERYENHVAIGAAVSLTDAFAALVEQRPQLKSFANRFAGLPVRNSGTLGGNVANGSPIGDSMPWLIALGSELVLRGPDGERTMPLENFYLGYQVKDWRDGEFVQAVRVPLPRKNVAFRTYKLAKRFDQDISAVCAAFAFTLEDGIVVEARIAYGGMAATPKRAAQAESLLNGRAWDEAAVTDAMAALAQDYAPLSDMRASSAYRMKTAQNLLRRYWLETRKDNPLPPAAVNPFANKTPTALA
jgi:xanthine dehydrogenase small subunit